MDRSLATLSLSEAEARVAAATPADANTAPLQLQAEAAHHLQRLDAKLLSWLERSDEEDDEDVLEPETHAERQLAQLCAQAAEKNLTSAYVLVRTAEKGWREGERSERDELGRRGSEKDRQRGQEAETHTHRQRNSEIDVCMSGTDQQKPGSSG